MNFAEAICFGTDGTGCSVLWVMMIVLFFIAAIIRKQAEDIFDYSFSLIGALVAGELLFIILYLITDAVKWGFIAGLVGVLAGGILTGLFFGGDSGY